MSDRCARSRSAVTKCKAMAIRYRERFVPYPARVVPVSRKKSLAKGCITSNSIGNRADQSLVVPVSFYWHSNAPLYLRRHRNPVHRAVRQTEPAARREIQLETSNVNDNRCKQHER